MLKILNSLLLILALVVSKLALAQDHPAYVKDSTDLYYRTLKDYLNPHSNSADNTIKYLRVYSEYEITDGLPTHINGVSVQYFDNKRLRDSTRKNKSLLVQEIFPARIEGDSVKIVLGGFSVSRRKKRLYLLRDCTYIVTFKLSCADKKYVLMHNYSHCI